MFLQGLEEQTRHLSGVEHAAGTPDVHGRARFLSLPDNRRLAYSELGDVQGFPLFYLHSHAGSRLEGRFFHDSARAAGFRLIAIDRSGLGLSDFNPGAGKSSHADDLLLLADHLDLGSFGLLSWSGGVTAALAVAAATPERVKFQLSLAPVSLTASVVDGDGLIDTVVTGLRMSFWKALIRTRCHLASRWLGPEHYLSRLKQLVSAVDRRVLESPEVLACMRRNMREAARQGDEGVISDLLCGLAATRLAREPVTVPVQFWQGMSDALVPGHSIQQIADMLPFASCHRVPGQGHFGFLQDSSAILLAARRRFLSSTCRPQGLYPASEAQDICRRRDEPGSWSPVIAGVRK